MAARSAKHVAYWSSAGTALAATAFLASTRYDTVARAEAGAGAVNKGSRPAAVEIHCSPISPTCSRYKAFLSWQKVPVKVVNTLPLGSDCPPHTVADGVAVSAAGLVAQVRAASDVQASTAAKLAAEEEEAHWVKLVDEKLIPIVFVNVFRSPPECKEVMNAATKLADYNLVYSTLLCRLGSYYNYAIAKMAKRQMENLTAHTGERIVLIELLNAWATAVGSRAMMGGTEPNMADFAVYGALKVMEGTSSFNQVMCQSKVRPWYDRIAQKVDG
jgi:microsomal prostaglandin-E synthase 2